MTTPALYSCDDHLDLWNLPRDLWQGRLPSRFAERAPCVKEQGDTAWWTCDGSILGPFGTRLVKDYSAIARAGIEDDGMRAANPKLRLDDMDRDGVQVSVIYGPNLLGLNIDDVELKAATLAGYNDWAAEFNRHAPTRLSVLAVLPTHAAESAAAELQRVARLGHRGAIISPFEFRCADPEWERFWDVAEECGLPIMAHLDAPPPSRHEVMSRLRPGDVLTHCFRPFPNAPVRADGKVRDEIIAARARGVIFDIGHGGGSFGFGTTRAMLAAGFLPDVISSDVHVISIEGPAYDLLTTMSKFLCLGVDLPTVLKLATVNAAAAIKRPDLGTLKVGNVGEATVIDQVSGKFDYADSIGEHMMGDQRLLSAGVVLAGKWWHPV